MSKFSDVLRSRNFFCLWLGQIISQVGDRLDQMALIAFVYSRSPGSAYEIAKILSFTIIPVFLIGPIAGVYVDRWDRRKTLFICDFLRAALVLAIPVFLFYSKNLTWIYLIIFIVFSIGRFFVPAKLSIVPELVKKEDLLIANTLVNATGMIAAVLGFGVSGVIVEWLGARSGFFLDSLSFLISGTLIFLIAKKYSIQRSNVKIGGREIVEVMRKSVLAEIKDGILYFIKNKEIRFTAWMIFALWAALGSTYVVIIVFVQKTLHSATKDLGLLVMFLGIGLFAGSLVYGRFGQRLSHFKTIFSSLMLSGAMLIIFSVMVHQYPNFIVAAIFAFLLGIAISPIMIATNTIVHNASSSSMLGKIFSSLEIVMHLGFLIFMFISSILAEAFSPFIILVIVGSAIMFLGLVNLACQRKVSWLN
ncbi:MAG: MFS transporter [Candidatus Omnitrophota bacterium]